MEPTITLFGFTMPVPVASALIGAGVAGGVALVTLVASTWVAGRRFRAQLTHDREQKNEDRKSAIRREVYLKAVADSEAVAAELGGLLQRDLATNPGTDVLNAFLTSLSKVSLVAEPPAALLAQELMAQMTEHYFRCLPAAVQYHHARADVPRLRGYIASFQEQQNRIGLDIALAQEKGEPQERIERLLQSSDNFRELIERIAANIDRVEESTKDLQHKYVDLMFESGKKPRETFMRLMAASRRELHLEPLEAEFLERFSTDGMRAEKLLKNAGLR